MFTGNHLIWLGICALLTCAGLVLLIRKKVPLNTVLSVGCVLAVCSEYVKIFSMVEMLPVAGGVGNYPYLKLPHLPFHLCSVQLILVWCARFMKPSARRDMLLAFMYPACAAGAFSALLMPNIFEGPVTISQAFTHPLPFQYFIWHSYLLVLGICIPLSGEVQLTLRHCLGTMGCIALLGFVSIYINALCTIPVVDAATGQLTAVQRETANFFFSMQTPVGIPLYSKGQWLLYYLIMHLTAWLAILLLYLPFLRKKKR